MILGIISIFESCMPEYYKFNKYIRYLDKDSTYKTIEEKVKFEELKAHFLKVWNDTSNCAIHDFPIYNNGIDYVYKNAEVVYVDNILHTPKYDTLLVLVTIYGKDKDEKGNLITNDDGSARETTISKGIKVLVGKDGKWNFNCKMGGGSELTTSKDINGLSNEFRKEVIRWSYFKKDKTQDTTFFHRLFTESVHPKPPAWWFMYRLIHPRTKDTPH